MTGAVIAIFSGVRTGAVMEILLPPEFSPDMYRKSRRNGLPPPSPITVANISRGYRLISTPSIWPTTSYLGVSTILLP